MSVIPNIGVWDGPLFATFRKLAGPPPPRGGKPAKTPPLARLTKLARMTLDLLIRQNEPLIKTLVAQLCGIGEQKPRRGLKTQLGGMQGAELLSWDDALNAGRLGFAKACIGFDPSKGKISFYALQKIRHELQTIIPRESTVYAPRYKEYLRPQCALIGDPLELEAMRPEGVVPNLIELDGLTPELVDEWAETGQWPERDAWEASRAPAVVTAEAPKLISIPPPQILTPLERFLKDRCSFASSARVTQWQVWNAFRLECRLRGLPEPTRAVVVEELRVSRGVREVKVRDPWTGSPFRGLAGVRMATVWPSTPGYGNSAGVAGNTGA